MSVGDCAQANTASDFSARKEKLHDDEHWYPDCLIGFRIRRPDAPRAPAIAADQWFVLGEQTIEAADPSAQIKSTGNRWDKDVKQVKLSAEGADVQITQLVLNWDNRKDAR